MSEYNNDEYQMVYSQSHIKNIQQENQSLREQLQQKDRELLRMLREKNEAVIKYQNLLKDQQEENEQQAGNYFYIDESDLQNNKKGRQNQNSNLEEELNKKNRELDTLQQELQQLKKQLLGSFDQDNLIHQLQKEKMHLENELKSNQYLYLSKSQQFDNTEKELGQNLMQVQELQLKVDQLQEEIYNYDFILNNIDCDTFMQKQAQKIEEILKQEQNEKDQTQRNEKWTYQLKLIIQTLLQHAELNNITFKLPQIQIKNQNYSQQ